MQVCTLPMYVGMYVYSIQHEKVFIEYWQKSVIGKSHLIKLSAFKWTMIARWDVSQFIKSHFLSTLFDSQNFVKTACAMPIHEWDLLEFRAVLTELYKVSSLHTYNHIHIYKEIIGRENRNDKLNWDFMALTGRIEINVY